MAIGPIQENHKKQLIHENCTSLFDWVETDDLNEGVTRVGQKIENDLHMLAQGYVILVNVLRKKVLG